MENNKIIIKVPNELKKDLSNTKALDGEKIESFFQSVDLRDENTLKGYFEGYKILYYEVISQIEKTHFWNDRKLKTLKEELKGIKNTLLSLEKVFDEIYGEKSFEEKGNFSLNLRTNEDEKKKNEYNNLDRFYYKISKIKINQEKIQNDFIVNENKIFEKRLAKYKEFKNINQIEKDIIKKQIAKLEKRKDDFINDPWNEFGEEVKNEDYEEFQNLLKKLKLVNKQKFNFSKKFKFDESELEKIIYFFGNFESLDDYLYKLYFFNETKIKEYKEIFNIALKKPNVIISPIISLILKLVENQEESNSNDFDDGIDLLDNELEEEMHKLDKIKEKNPELYMKISDVDNVEYASYYLDNNEILRNKDDYKKGLFDNDDSVVNKSILGLHRLINSTNFNKESFDFVKSCSDGFLHILKRKDTENILEVLKVLKDILIKDHDNSYIGNFLPEFKILLLNLNSEYFYNNTRIVDDYIDKSNEILEILKETTKKEGGIILIKNLFSNDEIKNNLCSKRYIKKTTLKILGIITTYDNNPNFIKDLFSKEELKNGLINDSLFFTNILIKFIVVANHNDVINYIQNLKGEFKTSLENNNWGIKGQFIILLELLAKKGYIEFVKEFKVEIKKILSNIYENNYGIATNSIINVLFLIAKKDLEFVIEFREELKNKFIYLYNDLRNTSLGTLELLKIISKENRKIAYDILSFKNTSLQHQEIKEFIENHESGSCLFSGYRGVGKTSLIKSVIHEVKSEKNIIEIIVNIPELDKEQELDKKTMLDRIITKTYETIKNENGIDEFKQDIEYHYKRVYNDIRNTKSISSTSEITKIEFFIKNILKFIIFLEVSFLIIVGIGFILLNLNIYIYNYLSLKYLYQIKDIPFIKESLIPLILGLGFFYKKWKINEENKQEIEEIYTPDIAEDKLVRSINNLYKKEKIKIVFVIDELDKLLDFEKISDSKEKQKIDMKQVFEVLGKLKTLFFETKGALFFVVTNKQAYDYYLQNKHQEDDMISNIFNKVIYLSANSIENFNLHHNIEISGEKENEKLRDKLKKYFYFKSHGNWRKSKFELSQIIKGDTIEIDREKFDFEYKFYEFFDKLYQTFEKGSLDNIDYKTKIFNDFLFSLNHEKLGYITKMFEDYVIINQKNESNKNNIGNSSLKDKLGEEFYKIYIQKLETLDQTKEQTNQISNEIKVKYYSIYLEKVKQLIIGKKQEYLKDGNTDLFILEYLNFIQKEFTKTDFPKRKFFGYFVASIEKVSNEYAYRDYIISYLLNIYENIKFLRKTTLDEVLKNIKINAEDLKYPVFPDLMLYWLPLMLIYFSNIDTDVKQ